MRSGVICEITSDENSGFCVLSFKIRKRQFKRFVFNKITKINAVRLRPVSRDTACHMKEIQVCQDSALVRERCCQFCELDKTRKSKGSSLSWQNTMSRFYTLMNIAVSFVHYVLTFELFPSRSPYKLTNPPCGSLVAITLMSYEYLHGSYRTKYFRSRRE